MSLIFLRDRLNWALLVALCLAPLDGAAQEDGLARPGFLSAVGLLNSEPFQADAERLGKPVPVPFSLEIPSSGDVGHRVDAEVDGALFAVEFGTTEGGFVEAVVFTEAQVSLGTDEQRAFAMANLLVLRSFPSLRETFPDAQLAGFNVVTLGDNRVVQMVGTYTGPNERAIVFRHVGFLPEGSTDVVVAIVNIARAAMPVRDNDALDDTYSGHLLASLVFSAPVD